MKYINLIIFSILIISLLSCSNTENSYYENGNLKEEYKVIDSKKNGIYRAYFKDGNLKEYSIYRNDIKIDSSLVYYNTPP